MQLALYYTQSCPYCIRVLNILDGLSLDIELKNISRDRALRQELLKNGGKSQVPCLRVTKPGGSETWLYESLDIIRFLKRLDNEKRAS